MTEAREIVVPLTYHSQDQFDVFHDSHRYVVVRAGRRWGKTVGAATWLIETCFEQAGLKVLWVDVRQTNISRYVNEVFLPRLPPATKVKWSEQKKILTFPNKSYIVFASAERPEGMEGFAYDVVVLNEAGIILRQRPKMWSASILPMTMENKNVRVLFVGTPKPGGYLFKQFSSRARSDEPVDSDWVEYHRTSFDNPMLDDEQIEQVKDAIEDDVLIPSEIYGEFPDEGGGYLVMKPILVEEALDRDVKLSEGYGVKWGLDVAGAGADRTVLCKRQRNQIIGKLLHYDDPDTMRQAAMVREEYDNTPDELKPTDIYVDANGLGKGMFDRLNEYRLPARGVMVTNKPVDPRFYSLRDELWWSARGWIEEKTCTIGDNRELARDLSVPMYDPAYGRGVIKIDSKKDMKKRGARSPDFADAFCLTFAGGRDRLTNRLPSGSKKQRRRGWMAA